MEETLGALSRQVGTADPVALAEILWLARFLPGRRIASSETEHRAEAEPGAVARPPAGSPSPSRAGAAGRPEQSGPPAEIPVESGSAALYVAADAARPSGLPTRAPAVPALAQTLKTARALRPFRRRVPARWETALDEVATAEASAGAGRPRPVLRAAEERWLDLAIVVDDAPSMVVWRRTVTEMRTLLERLGAFRDVRLWRIDSGLDGYGVPLLREGRGDPAGRPGTVRDPKELIAADGRRMVLVVSDCVGPVWLRGTLSRWLEMWGRSGPVALIQPLPQRLWRRCSLDIVRTRMTASMPGLPNSRLRVVARDSDYRPAGVPIPVLELEPRWLAPWARLVAAPGAEPMWGAATFTQWSPRGRIFAGRTGTEDRAADPAEVLGRARKDMSPEAFDLATYLSAAPLSLPVMRLVQRIMMPRSRPRHLAELFLSGLLVRTTPYLAGQDAERVMYEFRPGTRELLAAVLEPNTGLRVLSRVSDFIARNYGAALDFPALLGGAEPPVLLDEPSRPFAQVAQTVLRSLGGRYENLADHLAKAMRHVEPYPIRQAGAHARPERRSGGVVLNGGAVSSSANSGAELGRAMTPPAVWGGVPPRNPNFTGREFLLAALREQLTSKVTAVLPHTLHGLGGVGKTQLAIEYVYQYRHHYDLVWWIPSEQSSQIRESLIALAERLDLPAFEDANQRLLAINDMLRTQKPYQRWLLVFDNADNADDLAPFLSNPGGHILITSRNRNWTSFAQTVEVDVFEREESVELLRRRLPAIDPADADLLADRLGDLPLALEQAAAWQAATGTPAQRYLELLPDRVSTLLSEEKPANYPRPVAEVFGLAFRQLTERGPAALQVLQLCAFLGSEPISVRLLLSGRRITDRLAGGPNRALAEAFGDEILLRRAVREIDRYGLAKVDPSRNSLQVHRLVQALLRDTLSAAEQETYVGIVHALLAAANPTESPDERETWPRHEELSAHIVPARLVDGTEPDVRRVVLDQMRYRWVRGDLEGSRELAALAETTWRRALGREHEHTLIAGRQLAIALRQLGLVEDARSLNEEIFETATRALGENHEHTVSIGNSRGADLRLLGDWPAALELDTDLLARHEEIFGQDDPNTFRAANNLAVDYRLLGRFEDARRTDEDTIARLRRSLGFEHADTLRMASNLARDYYGLGQYDRARNLFDRWLPVQRQLFGADHADVIRSTRIYVVTVRKMGLTAEAYDMARDIAETARRRLGEEAPDTILAMMTLCNCLTAVGQLTEAKIVGEDALAALHRRLGSDHPFTLAAATNLATVMRLLIQHPTARELDEESLAGFRSRLGEDHLYTFCATMNLSNDLSVSGDPAAARELSEQALEGMIRVFGEEHPQTVACRQNLVLDLEATGDSESAHVLRQETLAQYRRVFGPTHPETRSMEAGRRASIEIEPPNW